MKYTNKQLAYLILRIAVGVNLIVHGLARIGHLGEFASSIAAGFEDTSILPRLAMYYAYFIPIFELVMGLLIFFGLFLRQSLFLGGLFIATLIIGMGFQENWSVVGTQMIYVLLFYFLLKNVDDNIFTLKWK